ncbi:MAG TPA: hypothetical protein VEV38_03390, partial [Candidatus Eremiobacteraceae bacterium]|nr:hypothetical protein [Candidatus Eremiobacteraceae bacterium]
MKKLQRGIALVTALAIVAICLAVAIMILELATHNSQNVGAGYTKQQYFDVAEAGIDRGLTDIDSNLPAPGSTSFATSPPTPPATPSTDQTALPSIPNVIYYYSYWHNNSAATVSTPNPLVAQGFDGAPDPISVPAYGTLVWSYTKNTGRDVGIETLATVFYSQHTSCAMCAGGNITESGAISTPAPAYCTQNGTNLKICTDPSPNPTPTWVPIVAGGSYTPKPGCGSCAFGDGTAGSIFSNISTNAQTGSFLAPQSTIDTMSNASYWKGLSQTSSTVTYKLCSSACGA